MVDFTNLKSLNQLISGNEINGFATGLKKAKQTLDSYCKGLKEVYSKKKTAVQKPVQKVEVKEVVKTVLFDVNGRVVNAVVSGQPFMKVVYYNDGSVETEKAFQY